MNFSLFQGFQIGMTTSNEPGKHFFAKYDFFVYSEQIPPSIHTRLSDYNIFSTSTQFSYTLNPPTY